MSVRAPDMRAATLEALSHLPDDVSLTFTVSAGDLRRALESRAGKGPTLLTTEQAAATLGYTEDRWRRWAAKGKIAGAFQHSGGAPWRLPRNACEAWLDALRGAASSQKGKRGGARGPRRRSEPRVLPSDLARDGSVLSIADGRQT